MTITTATNARGRMVMSISGWSKHAKFDKFGNHIGRYTTKPTNQKRKKK